MNERAEQILKEATKKLRPTLNPDIVKLYAYVDEIPTNIAIEAINIAYEQGYKDCKEIQKGWEKLKDSGLDKPLGNIDVS